MKFNKTELKDAYLIEIEPINDHRGFFARTFCKKEFNKYGLDFDIVQNNLSLSYKKSTLRGMHYQVEGAEEIKVIRCIKGRILDVIIDIRTSSPTFGKHIKVELSDSNNLMLYVPRGFAHGFLTLEDNCEIFYLVSNFYTPDKERGIRWNDPFFKINWSIKNPIISEKDRNYGDYKI